MRIKLIGSYRNSKGTLMFRYLVSGTEAQLDAYKTAQGEFYRTISDTDLRPLFFTNRFAGDNADLIITKNGKIMADMSAFDAAASLASQYGGNLGAELAKQAVAQLLGKSTQVPEQQPVKQDEPNLDES